MRNSSPDFTKLHTKISKPQVFCWLVCFLLLFVNLAYPVFGFSYALEITPIIDNPLSSDDYWSGTEATLDIKSKTIPSKKTIVMSCSIKSAEECSYFFINYLSNFAILKGFQYTFDVELKNDINLGAKYWNNVKIPANCTLNFEGNFHHIYGLKLDGKISMGLVSSSSSGDVTFENLRVHSMCGEKIGRKTNPAQIIKDANIGAFLGSKTAGSVTIDNCDTYGNYYVSYTANSSSTLSISTSSGHIGGFVGSCYALTIKNSTNTIPISASNINYVGGFVGKTTNSCRMELCSNLGKISGSTAYAGGLVGYAKGLDLSNSQCCNLADVSTSLKDNISDRGYAGGLVGYIGSCLNSKISYAFNNNNVSSTYGVAGGLVGDSDIMISFNNVYNSGDVVTTKNLGLVDKTKSIRVWQDSSYPLYCDQSVITSPYGGNVVDNIYSMLQLIVDDCTVTYKAQRDVSLIGNDNNLDLIFKAYSVKPSCIVEQSQGSDYKYSIKVNLVNGRGDILFTNNYETGWESTYSNNQNKCLVYSGMKLLNNNTGNFDNYATVDDILEAEWSGERQDYDYYNYNNLLKGYKKVWYEDIFFKDYSSNYNGNVRYYYVSNSENDSVANIPSTKTTVVYPGESNMYTNSLNQYVYGTCTDILYNFYHEQYSVSSYNGFIKAFKGIEKLWINGTRMYMGFDSSNGLQDIIICPLLHLASYYNTTKHYDRYQDKWANVPFLLPIGVPGESSNYEIIKINLYNKPEMISGYYNKEDINSSYFDSKFGQKNSINNGMPVFKDMYWELSV